MVFGGLAASALLNAGIPGLEGLAASGVTGAVLTAAFVIAGFIILLVAVLGIVGGAVARKKPTLGGIRRHPGLGRGQRGQEGGASGSGGLIRTMK